MTNERTITAIQVSITDKLLAAYRQYSGNNIALSDDLFIFLTTPTPARDMFVESYCTCETSLQTNIVVLTYSAL